MIQLTNNVSIKQIMEATKKETGEKIYYYWDDNSSTWVEMNQDEYNQIIRGNKNGE